MTKINSTGTGGTRPTGGPESAESLQPTEKAKESNQASNATPLESAATASKPSEGDRFAAGDLKAAGDRLRQQLDSQLEKTEAKTGKDPYLEKGYTPEQIAQGLPHFAPPYVPVGLPPGGIMGNTNVAGSITANDEIRDVKLTPDQFQITDEGNLVITNEKLIEYFKSLKDSAAGQDIHLGITKTKPPSEE